MHIESFKVMEQPTENYSFNGHTQDYLSAVHTQNKLSSHSQTHFQTELSQSRIT